MYSVFTAAMKIADVVLLPEDLFSYCRVLCSTGQVKYLKARGLGIVGVEFASTYWKIFGLLVFDCFLIDAIAAGPNMHAYGVHLRDLQVLQSMSFSYEWGGSRATD